MDPITAFNYNAVLVDFQEFVIKDGCPLGMVHFPVAMHDEGGVGTLSPNVVGRESFEGIRELLFERNECPIAVAIRILGTHRL
jgi:hypothetical protein